MKFTYDELSRDWYLISIGDVIEGHFCVDCQDTIDMIPRSPENPCVDRHCLKCGKRRYGGQGSAVICDWMIPKSRRYYEEERTKKQKGETK